MSKFVTVAAVILALLLSVAHAQNKAFDYADLEQFVALNEGFEILNTALLNIGATDQFKRNRAYTLFAPSNAAFEVFSEEELNALLDDRGRLQALINNHIVSNKVLKKAIVDEAKKRKNNGKVQVRTVGGQTLEVVVTDDERLIVNGVEVNYSDIEARNHVVYVVDQLLVGASGSTLSPLPQTNR